jgi:SAM-dependent methyltransferase
MNSDLAVAKWAHVIAELWCACLLCIACTTHAADYQPERGQDGKDVMWVPTPDALVNTMLDLAKVGASDYVIDLGSGDGRLVIMAAGRGAQALGIEYDARLVEYAKAAAAKADVAAKAQFVKADLFAADFSRATVVTLFLGADLNRKLLPKLLELKPGTRIVSNTHAVGDWPADETMISSDDPRSVYYRRALLWIVPAKVAGTWRFENGSMTFAQRFQKVSGSVTQHGRFAPITGATLHGAEIRFSAGGVNYTGEVKGDVIEGTITQVDITQPWRATRAKPMK